MKLCITALSLLTTTLVQATNKITGHFGNNTNTTGGDSFYEKTGYWISAGALFAFSALGEGVSVKRLMQAFRGQNLRETVYHTVPAMGYSLLSAILVGAGLWFTDEYDLDTCTAIALIWVAGNMLIQDAGLVLKAEQEKKSTLRFQPLLHAGSDIQSAPARPPLSHASKCELLLTVKGFLLVGLGIAGYELNVHSNTDKWGYKATCGLWAPVLFHGAWDVVGYCTNSLIRPREPEPIRVALI